MSRVFRRTLVWALLAVATTGGLYTGHQIRRTDPLHWDRLARARALLLSASSGGVGGAGGGIGREADATPAEIFETVLDYVQRDYVEEVNNPAQLSNGALSRMFASLDDPKTYFLEPTLRRARQDALTGRFQGIGAALAVTKSKKDDVDYRHLSVVAVMPGSPAEKAGLRPGDRITEINGRWVIAYSILVDVERLHKAPKDDATDKDSPAAKDDLKQVTEKFKKGYTVAKALALLNTGSGAALKLTVERPGQPAPLVMEMTTAITPVDPVEFRIVGNRIGYLRVRQFNKQATDEFQSALSKAGANLKGLIVDLRENPGGVRAASSTGANGYDSALKLLGHLTRGGTVAMIERKPNERKPLTLTPEAPALSLPMVVLVDQGTANLSELVAAALREVSKAKVIGARTFGDAILQSFTALNDGSGVEIATARLFTASGADLAKGVTPDIQVAANVSDGNGADAALERALQTLGAG
ncbi:MAG TPA: S41 family peptidase [Chthonomonadaceae bacterium]|nr:S41 family peptidase [Chthonomonadaceae bacterium]